MKIGFLTGARSEYGVMRQLIQRVSEDSFFTLVIYATGMHFQQKYGLTINELKADNFGLIVEMPCYTEEQRDKKDDFVALIDVISAGLIANRPDILYLIGDRLEAYAGALAVHFVTNKYAYERLQQIPIIENDTIHLVGSSAVDNIVNYLKTPRGLTDLDPRLERDSFVLMTYHSQTVGSFDIPAAMELSIRTIIEKDKRVLITYPNNDDGSEVILDVINRWSSNENVIVIPNLGAKNYHAAIDNCLFVIGNSSSGVIEVPYFDKFTVNVGQRQSGRNAPKSVINTESDIELLKSTICDIIDGKLSVPEQEYIYGRGQSIAEIIRVLKSIKF